MLSLVEPSWIGGSLEDFVVIDDMGQFIFTMLACYCIPLEKAVTIQSLFNSRRIHAKIVWSSGRLQTDIATD